MRQTTSKRVTTDTPTERGDLAYWADMALLIEKARVATQVGLSHLARRRRTSPDRESFLQEIRRTEDFADGMLARRIVGHPVWEWASRIKGVGKENLPKVVGLIEAFGRYYDVGDPMIPPYVDREPETYYTVVKKVEQTDELQVEVKEEIVEKVGVWVEGIERLTMPSKLFKYAGMHVVDGKAPRREKGKLLGYNSELRMAIHRLVTGLVRGGARGNSVWFQQYHQIREEIQRRKEAQGVKVVPTPQMRTCAECSTEVTAKKTSYCPKCGNKLGLKEEGEGQMFLQHLHLMTLRELAKRWLVCLWLVWRQELGLPITQPYSVVYKEHKPVEPWEMVDR